MANPTVQSAVALARFHRKLIEEGVRPPLADKLTEEAARSLVTRSGLVVGNG